MTFNFQPLKKLELRECEIPWPFFQDCLPAFSNLLKLDVTLNWSSDSIYKQQIFNLGWAPLQYVAVGFKMLIFVPMMIASI